jgi:hypothetical protein
MLHAEAHGIADGHARADEHSQPIAGAHRDGAPLPLPEPHAHSMEYTETDDACDGEISHRRCKRR